MPLPGSVSLTKTNPATQPDVTKQTVYSLKNYHGDTVLTFTSEGKTNSADPATNLLKAYGPFGESLISGTLGATTSTQINASDVSMGWAANPTRKEQSGFTLGIIQMGARVYIPSLGRFLQVDPIQGGTLNPYVYAHDPVNLEDYNGQFLGLLTSIVSRITAPKVVKTVKATVNYVKKNPSVALGLIPILGTALDVKSAADAAKNRNPTEFSLAMIGFIPGIGDMAKGAGKAARGSSAVPSNIPGKNFHPSPQEAYKHLENKHGIDPHLASTRLHNIKAANGLRPNDNVVFGATGDIYDAVSGDYLGSLTQGGAKF